MASNSPEDGTTTTKCFSAILNRLLCTGSLPTHPSDQDHLPHVLKSTQSTHQPKVLPNTKPIQAGPSSTPGVIARLMGLDPFPDITSSSLPKSRTLDSFLRSRSVNYVDYYMPHLDFTKQVQAQAQDEAHDKARHRRVRTSVSFRELPTFLLPENHDLLVLCLDQVDEITKKHELGLKEMMRSKNNSLSKREKEEKHKNSCKRKEDELKPKKVAKMRPSPKPKAGNCLDQKRDVLAKSSACLKRPKSPTNPTINRKEVPARKRNNRNQNPSSNFADGGLDSPMPGPRELRSRKVSSPRSNKYDHPCPNYTRRLKENVQEQKRRPNSKINKPSNKECNYLVEMLTEICRLAEEDTKMGFAWMAGYSLDYEDYEEICFEFERETLEMLLAQVVDELCSSSQDLYSTPT